MAYRMLSHQGLAERKGPRIKRGPFRVAEIPTRRGFYPDAFIEPVADARHCGGKSKPLEARKECVLKNAPGADAFPLQDGLATLPTGRAFEAKVLSLPFVVPRWACEGATAVT